MQRIATLYIRCIKFKPVQISSVLNRYVNLNFSHNIPRVSVVRSLCKCKFNGATPGPVTRSKTLVLAFTLAGLMKFLGLSEEEDSELVQIMKRAEMQMLKKEYNLSEKLFHVALKIAQDLQNEDAITYIYDRLANVAFETGQNEKARKLFVDVVQRLIEKGMAEDDIIMIHISFKLAKIFESVKDYKTAQLGYQYCIDSIKSKLTEEEAPDYNDVRELWLMILTGYAYFHYHLKQWDEALKWFQQAYDACMQIFGEQHEKTILLLNNLGSVHRRKGDSDAALMYFHKAEKIGKTFPEMEDFVFIYLNLAYLYMEHKMFDEARRYCNRALVNSSRLENENNKKQADECLNEVAKLVQ